MNDEQRNLLMAHCDGELDAVGSQAARKLIETDAEARAYWDQLQRVESRLHAAFDPILSEPIPTGMLAMLHRRRRRRWLQLSVPLGLAASLALVALLLVRQGTIDQQMQEQLLQMQREIAQLRHQTLEHVPSGTVASWVAPTGGARAEVTPIKTYRTKDNQFCREYQERIEDAEGVEIRRGIACRAGKAMWPDRVARQALGSGGGAGIKL